MLFEKYSKNEKRNSWEIGSKYDSNDLEYAHWSNTEIKGKTNFFTLTF